MKKIILSVSTFLILGSSSFGWTLGKYGEMEFKNYGKNVYILHGPTVEPNVENEGFINNPAVIESKKGLIVIDPGGNYNVGKKILKEIEKVSKKPIIAILNTHKHGDHWFANRAIQEKYPKIDIYAHPNMIKEVKAGEADKWYGILDRLSKNLSGTKPYSFPNHELKDGEKLNIDGEIFIVHHPKRAHSDSDLLIEHKNSNSLFLGDNVMKSRLGGFDESSSILGNITLLQNIMKDGNYTLYIPGHGQSGDKVSTVKPFLTYLETIADEAKKAYEKEEEYYTAKKPASDRLKDYHNWDAFNRQMGKHLNKVYREIEENDM
jgi:glyoxylase-like metal-dependent hydrolase (beta-lactamase superfamily II)